MSFWPIVFIFLAIAMAVGPIMMMQPSSHSKRIANLRQQAAQLGLSLRLANYVIRQEKNSVAVYSLQCDLPKTMMAWVLLRQGYQHGTHFHNDWDWQKSAKTSSPIASSTASLHFINLGLFRDFLDQLPEDIVGIEANSRQVGLWWGEHSKEITVAMIKNWLQELEGFLQKTSKESLSHEQLKD